MRIKKLLVVLLLFYGVFSFYLQAAKYELSVAGLSKSEFEQFLKEFVTVIGYRDNRPAETFGILGFEAGVGYDYYKIGHNKLWEKVYNDRHLSEGQSGVYAHIRKGLFFNLDVGARYGKLLDTDINYYGAELRYGISRGSFITPAIALTLNYTKVNNFSDMTLKSYGANLSISKGLGPLTPYAGVGVQHVEGTPYRISGLSKTSVNEFVKFVGFRFSFTPVNYINLQVTSDENLIWSLTANFGF